MTTRVRPPNFYRERGLHFLAQAREELARGDFAQASEKGWGAAAQMTKAVAAHRGWRHGSHYMLYDVAQRIKRETDNLDTALLFNSAEALHSNFYEGWMPPEQVEDSLEAVARYVALMERVLDASG